MKNQYTTPQTESMELKSMTSLLTVSDPNGEMNEGGEI